MPHYGASPEAWDHFVSLGLTEHLLPVVSNPTATISPNSMMRDLGKTPSFYNAQRQASGFPKWTEYQATPKAIAHWRSEPDYGICIQARAIRAIDIDVADWGKSSTLYGLIMTCLGGQVLPARRRGNSGKLLLAYRLPAGTYFPKRVMPVDGGIIEFLGDGQQFIADGTHPSGVRYEWDDGLPTEFPELTLEEIEGLWQRLLTLASTGEPRIAGDRRKRGEDLPIHDDVADWLSANWETYGVGSDGQLFIECPFAGDHTSDSGPSATAYFPAGTGGYQQGHFVCLHAHCAGRPDRDYQDATGYSLAQFDELPTDAADAGGAGGNRSAGEPGEHALGVSAGVGASDLAGRGEAEPHRSTEDPAWPKLKRDDKGLIEATAGNLVAAVASGRMIGRRLAYDAFTDSLMWCHLDEERLVPVPWRRFGDSDSVEVRIELENRGFKPMGRELLRDCIAAAAHKNTIDLARDWLGRLRWDGVPRIARFAIDCWGWEDSPYSEAVGRYLWTAMAGRVLEPGCQADMVPILVGAQGIRKTSLIKAMAPSDEFYTEIKLDDRDDNLSRKLRGKIVGELEELRGLNSRAIEEIKAFITRRRESWVPKFKEFENFFYRRLIMLGSTNEMQFLADPTGERRFLPGKCGRIDVERLLATRDQLWAEGAAKFLVDGIDWQDAERLAKEEHYKFKIGDTWERRIATWMRDHDTPVDGRAPIDKGYVTVDEVLNHAINIPLTQQNRAAEMRVMKALQHLGLRQEGERFVVEG